MKKIIFEEKMTEFNSIYSPADLIRINNGYALIDGDRQIVHDDFLKEIGTLFFLMPKGFRSIYQCFGEFRMSDLKDPSKNRSADFLVERCLQFYPTDILGECKLEIINQKIITETVFNRHYRKVYEQDPGRKADIWYLSPFAASRETLKMLTEMNAELERSDKILTYCQFVKMVLTRLEKWAKETGNERDYLHTKRQVSEKCKLLFRYK